MDAWAIWYGVLREQGEFPDSIGAHFDEPGPPARRWILPHERYDGARAMELMLTDLGHPPPQSAAPPKTARPSWIARARAFCAELAGSKLAPVRWRSFDASARGSSETVVAYAFFDRDETAALERRARSLGARTNSLLLWALDRAVHDVVAFPAPSHRWSVPVNMRAWLGDSLGALDNVASFIAVDVDESASAADVKSAIRAELERNAHWGPWDAFRVLGLLGVGYMRRYAHKYFARPGHAWMGTFSNVGAFEGDVGWLSAVPPVLRSHPVGASALDVGGRLTLALRTHPVLGAVDNAALAARWKALALGALDSDADDHAREASLLGGLVDAELLRRGD